jgi:glycosyltransferase involved in cell wall biosynthesis
MNPNTKLLPSILFISRDFPPRFTGDGKFIADMTARLAASGYSITIICEQENGDVIDPKGVKVIRLPVNGQNRRLRRLAFVLRIMCLILSGKVPADIIVTHAEPLFIPLIKLTKALGKKWVYRTTLFGTDDGLSLSKYTVGRILLRALSQADAIICVTDLFYDSFAQAGLDASHLVVIPYAVDTNVYKPIDLTQKRILKQELGIQGAPVVLFVGGIVQRKGIDLLAHAWKYVLAEWPAARLLLVGPLYLGMEKQRIFVDEIRGIIESYSGLESVTFVGEVSDASPYDRVCDLFVFPSRQEGFGMAMIEAMACRKPVITANFIGYTPFLGRHGQELYVTQPDKNEIANAMCEVLRDHHLQTNLANSSYPWAAEQFSFENVTALYSDLFKQLVKQ